MIKDSVSGALTVERWGDRTIDRCVDFVVFAKKYGLGSVDKLVHKPLKTAIISSGGKGFRGEHIEKIFDATSEESILRVLVAQAALSTGGTGKVNPYGKQEKDVHGFAAAYLQQLRLASSYIAWEDPLSLKAKRKHNDFMDGSISDASIS